jgi:hypothetical protein
MQDEAATQAAYRFLQTPDMTYEKLIRPPSSSARRDPFSCSTSFRLGFDLKIVIKS